ncbi:MAG: hypothetical protein ACRDHZ_15220 [Ktedonobacteraceae bacterium]
MQRQAKFDWLAVGIAIFITAFFALTARFNSQPAPSFVPAAVLSATGCGLLVTALRKMRGRLGVGLLEAGLGGFSLAFFQFAMSFTYPGMFTIITTVPTASHAFLLTWGLIGLFAVAVSIAGAALGHLVFSPPRPLATAEVDLANNDEITEEDEDADVEEQADNGEEIQIVLEEVVEETEDTQSAEAENPVVELMASETEDGQDEDVEGDTNEDADVEVVTSQATKRPHLLIIYLIGVLLIGLLPMVIGYVFAAAYDFTMNAINVQQLFPSFYPTLSLLSGLLPWRQAVQINLANANGGFIIFVLLWRIPDSVLGNPNIFDVQALEPLLLNATALAILLFTMYKRDSHESKPQAAPWGVFIGLETLLGLIIVLPSNLWLIRGLEGILQFQDQAVPLPPLYLLDMTTFTLNLVTGVVFSVLIGLVVRRQYQLWTQPREEVSEEDQQLQYEEEALEAEQVL